MALTDGRGWIAANKIGDEGGKAIAEALKVNGSETLTVSNLFIYEMLGFAYRTRRALVPSSLGP